MLRGILFLCLCLLTEAADQECTQATSRREATVVHHGKELLVTEESFDKKKWGKDEFYYSLHKSKSVYYVPNFLNESMALELQSFCLDQDRFVSSPVRGKAVDENGNDVTKDSLVRTSESCTMVPAFTYLQNPRFQAMLQDEENANDQTRAIIREVQVSWEVSQRAASLLKWDATEVEPLQIVRYTTPDAFYTEHHDHGEYYGKKQELRPWTVLVFLNDVPKGGYTYFPKLDLRVVPRGGDAMAWSNVVQGTNKADPDMVHAGEPPSEHGVEKYAVNIWLGESSLADSGGRWGANEKVD